MNQILMTENKKKKQKGSSGPLEVKSIVRFFAVVILIFGLALIGGGSYAIYKEADDKNPEKAPKVRIGRINDRAILYVDHSVEISKIIYSWDSGENIEIPQGFLTAQEEILLPNQNSNLNITIEDMNNKQYQYQKYYNIEEMDLKKPEIKIDYQNYNNKLTITAIDETEIAYLSYKWEDEETVEIDANTPGQTQIKQEIELTPGVRIITIIAEDVSGNIEKIEKEIQVSTSEPKIDITQDGKIFTIKASDEDGLKNISLNLNGKQYSQDINYRYVEVPMELREGNNTIKVEVTNINGYKKSVTKELQYAP